MFVAIAPDTLVSILHVLTPNSLILIIVLQHGETGRSMAATMQTTPHLTSLRDLVGQDLMTWSRAARETQLKATVHDFTPLRWQWSEGGGSLVLVQIQTNGGPCAVTCVLGTQPCSALCNPKDCSLPGFSARGFSRQEYWSGLPFPSAGNVPKPRIEPRSPALKAASLLP